MRLLDTKLLSLEDFDSENAPPYAILSHRWEEEEVTYQDLQSGRAHQRRGFAKIDACCRLARSRGFQYAWVDTCCIDKSSSAELTESINSMFRWYRDASECYAYLSDVRSPQLDTQHAQDEFSSSVWFTRGWTLQELIAPAAVLFCNRYWQYLGQKSELRRILSRITSIDPDILAGKMSLSECPIAQRMAWAANRTTTRLEDRAYSLLGIFDVYMPMLYGEGDRAFQRLQEEIIKQSDDHTLFAWKDKKFAKSVFAPSPSCFAGLDNLARIFPTNDTSQGFTLVNAGLSIKLQLIPWSMNTYLAPLRCGHISSAVSQSTRNSFRGYDRACIFLQQTDHENQFIRVSVSGRDLLVLSGDHVAEMRDQFGLSDNQILIRQLSPTSFIRPAARGFYGFVFSFGHDSMFAEGRRPTRQDAVCAHKWTRQRPVFEIGDGRHHAAGMFRLSGFSTGHYIYFGFDRDFAPLCLITTRSPRSRRFTILEPDFETLSDNDALRLLDINWLRGQIEEGTASGHAILAFKGERRTRTEVECSSLSLRLVFEWGHSQLTAMDSWHVSFRRLDRAESEDTNSPIGEAFDTSSSGFTSPFEVSRRVAQIRSDGNRVHRAKPTSMTKSTDQVPPRISVVDIDDDDIQVFQKRRPRYMAAGDFEEEDDIRVVKEPVRRSHNIVRTKSVDGNRVTRLKDVSNTTRTTAFTRPSRLSVDYGYMNDRDRPRSR